jgi:hypothetical protein
MKTLFHYFFILTFIFNVSVFFAKIFIFFKYGKFSFTIDGAGSGWFEIISETLAFVLIVFVGAVGGKFIESISRK